MKGAADRGIRSHGSTWVSLRYHEQAE